MNATKKRSNYTMDLTDHDRECIERIKQATGLRTTADVIRVALREKHRQLARHPGSTLLATSC